MIDAKGYWLFRPDREDRGRDSTRWNFARDVSTDGRGLRELISQPTPISRNSSISSFGLFADGQTLEKLWLPPRLLWLSICWCARVNDVPVRITLVRQIASLTRMSSFCG